MINGQMIKAPKLSSNLSPSDFESLEEESYYTGVIFKDCTLTGSSF